MNFAPFETLTKIPQVGIQELDPSSKISLQQVEDLELVSHFAESEMILSSDVKDKTLMTVEEGANDRSNISFEIGNLKEEGVMDDRVCLRKSIEELQFKTVFEDLPTNESEFVTKQSGTPVIQFNREVKSSTEESGCTHSVDVFKTNLEKQTLVPEFSVENLRSVITANRNLKNEIQKLKDDYTALNNEHINLSNESEGLREIKVSIEDEIRSMNSNLKSLTEENSCLRSSIIDLQKKLKLDDGEMRHHTREMLTSTLGDAKEIKYEHEIMQLSTSNEGILRTEISELKCKLISLEESEFEIKRELQVSKVENGKLIKKLKLSNSKNESLLQALEAKSSSLLSMEEEMRMQVEKILSERNEIKQKLDELEKEKILKGEADTFETAEERHFVHEKREGELLLCETVQTEELNHKISHLEYERENLMVDIVKLKKANEDLISELQKVTKQNDDLKSVVNDTECAKSKVESNMNTYKTNFLELHTTHESLKDKYNALKDDFSKLESDHVTLKSAYDVLYGDYHNLQEDKDFIRLELGVTCGERNKLLEEVKSLNNQLSALQEEEEVDVIKALQNECSTLREENSIIKDEVLFLYSKFLGNIFKSIFFLTLFLI